MLTIFKDPVVNILSREHSDRWPHLLLFLWWEDDHWHGWRWSGSWNPPWHLYPCYQCCHSRTSKRSYHRHSYVPWKLPGNFILFQLASWIFVEIEKTLFRAVFISQKEVTLESLSKYLTHLMLIFLMQVITFYYFLWSVSKKKILIAWVWLRESGWFCAVKVSTTKQGSCSRPCHNKGPKGAYSPSRQLGRSYKSHWDKLETIEELKARVNEAADVLVKGNPQRPLEVAMNQ